MQQREKNRLNKKKVVFNRLDLLYKQNEYEYEEAALRVLRSGWYIMGPELESFEREFAKYVGSSHCIGVNSGLDALTLAIRSLRIGPGDEVIVQANTYIASVLAITANGASPVFVEPDEFHGIEPEGIRKVISRRTKAIMVVHLYGQPCNMNLISGIAQSSGIPVIEDCAQSHGATIAGRMTGTVGSIGCFSFYPTKNLGAFGDGGAVVTDDPVLAEKIKTLRNYGSRVKYRNETEGINSRLDEIQAALLRVRLTHLEDILTGREKIARQYLDGIANPFLELPRIRADSRHTWHQFVIECEERDLLQAWLEVEGVQTRVHYPIPPHLSEAYASLGFFRGSFPITEKLSKTVLSLPVYNGLSQEDVAFVIEKLNAFCP